VYVDGHREPRAISRTRLRSVSCPRPSTIALAIEGSTGASAVAWKRVLSSSSLPDKGSQVSRSPAVTFAAR
jgi:hypothetical protein